MPATATKSKKKPAAKPKKKTTAKKTAKHSSKSDIVSDLKDRTGVSDLNNEMLAVLGESLPDFAAAEEIQMKYFRRLQAADVALGRKSKLIQYREGIMLLRFRNRIPHGQWESWVRDNCQFHERTARRYIRIAVSYPDEKSLLAAEHGDEQFAADTDGGKFIETIRAGQKRLENATKSFIKGLHKAVVDIRQTNNDWQNALQYVNGENIADSAIRKCLLGHLSNIKEFMEEQKTGVANESREFALAISTATATMQAESDKWDLQEEDDATNGDS